MNDGEGEGNFRAITRLETLATQATWNTERCPLFVLTSVRIKRVIFSEENMRAFYRGRRNCPLSPLYAGVSKVGVPLYCKRLGIISSFHHLTIYK